MIIIECKNDQFLLEKMGFNERDLLHEWGKGRVLISLDKGKGRIGLVDEDPGKSQPSVLRSYQIVETLETISLKKHRTKEIYICSLYPDLEGWIIKRSRTLGFDLRSYDIPETPESMHRTLDLVKRKGFDRLLGDLIKKDEEFKKVKHWLSEHQ